MYSCVLVGQAPPPPPPPTKSHIFIKINSYLVICHKAILLL